MNPRLRQLLGFPQRVWRWFKPAFWPAFALTMSMGAIVLARQIPESVEGQSQVACLSAALQCFGILLVVSGIMQTRVQFGQPNALRSALNWLRSFPRLFLKPISASAHITLDSMTVSGTAETRSALAAEATVEQRLASLSAEVVTLRNDLRTKSALLQESLTALKAELTSQTTTQADRSAATQNLVRAFALDGLPAALGGAILAFFGTIIEILPTG